jgi:hypothetical protein
MKYILKTVWLCVNLMIYTAVFSQQDQFEIKPVSPQVLRQGDHFEFTVILTNLSDSEITGQMQLLLSDAVTGESVDGWFQNVFPNQFFTVAGKSTESYKFPMEIPFQFTSSMHWQVAAVTRESKQDRSGLTPVLTNQFFRKEILRFALKPETTDVFVRSLAGSDKIPNLLQRRLSLDIMSTRLWEACKQIALMSEVQNKPLDYFEKWAALSYANFFIDYFPVIQNLSFKSPANTFFDQKQHNTIAELSPWVISSGLPVHAYAHLFARENNENALSNSLSFFEFAQNDDGSFPWYMGGNGDQAATKYISRTLQKMLTGGFIPANQLTSVTALKTKADKWLQLARHSTATPAGYANRQHDSLIAIIKTAIRKPTALPPIRWKAGNMQLNLNDTLRTGYAFQSVSGTLVSTVLSKSVITTRDTARSLTAIVSHDFFTDLPAGKPNQHLRMKKNIYIRRDSKTSVRADENTIFHQGDKLRIVLTLEAMHNINCLMVNDANPSTFYQKMPGMFVQRSNMKFYERQSPAGRKYFFPTLPAGKHEFVYETTVTQTGHFSEGMTTAESLVTPAIFNFIKGFPVTIE